MKNLKNKLIAIITVLVLFGGSMSVMAHKSFVANIVPAPQKIEETKLDLSATNAKNENIKTPVTEGDYICTSSLEIVDNPRKFLNKKVKFKAKFDKFSVLGLDYKPAFRDSEKYITFLIKRDDSPEHTIPLSEMKIFIQRTEAEKFIDLDSGDLIEVYGTVFSDALTDSWIDLEKLVILQKVKKNKEKQD